MLKTNIKSCIEKIIKKNCRGSWEDFKYIYFVDNKAVFFNQHILYEIDVNKVKNINPDFIASEKQYNCTKRIYDKSYKRVISDINKSYDKITITYKEALKLKEKQKANSYGLKYIRLESEKMVINIVLNNLLDCFRIFQNEVLTIHLFESNSSFSKKWYDNQSNKKVSIAPYVIESENNIFVAAPLMAINAHEEIAAA